MINLLITLYSAFNGIDPSLSFQIARVESNMNPSALSRTSDGGLFQLNRKIYKFHNPDWVFSPVINSALAMDTIGKLKTTCYHKINNSYVLCYNMGIRGARKVKLPFKQTYYQKMNIMWKS